VRVRWSGTGRLTRSGAVVLIDNLAVGELPTGGGSATSLAAAAASLHPLALQQASSSAVPPPAHYAHFDETMISID
jgi:hypothetical protein